jgi:hypothetical protein
MVTLEQTKQSPTQTLTERLTQTLTKKAHLKTMNVSLGLQASSPSEQMLLLLVISQRITHVQRTYGPSCANTRKPVHNLWI